MINNYETVFILTPVLSEVQMKDAVQKFVEILKSHKAEIVNVEEWGLRKLEYPIQHKKTGFYNLIEFNAEPEVVAALELEYRRDERIMRFLTISLDKHAVAYNERRRNGEFNKSETKEEKAA